MILSNYVSFNYVVISCFCMDSHAHCLMKLGLLGLFPLICLFLQTEVPPSAGIMRKNAGLKNLEVQNPNLN